MSQLNQALEHLRSGHLTQAEDLCRAILARDPNHADALHLLGVLAAQRGDYQKATDLIGQAIAINDGDADYYHDLGSALQAQARLDEAIAAYQRALARKTSFETFHNLGVALRERDRLAEAIEAFKQAVALRPQAAETHARLGDLLKTKGDIEGAIDAYQRATSLAPDPDTYDRLGVALQTRGRVAEAIDALRQAVALGRHQAELHFHLGNALRRNNQHSEAVASYRQAALLRPDHAGALNNLGMLMQAQGDLDEAPTLYRRALTADPTYKQAHSNLLLCLHYCSDTEPEMLFAEHTRWAKQHAPESIAGALTCVATPISDRPLRVGYVSPDFRAHSVAHFIAPVLAEHDQNRCEAVCYANVAEPDMVTKHLHTLSREWRDISEMNDDQVVTQVRDDAIDILVDLAGHTGRNRLGVFARKPVPVQVTYLGYPNTTGLTTIDCRLTDAIVDPPGPVDRWHSERLVRLPHGFLCYTPLEAPQPVHPLPAIETGHITFGSLNHTAKINRDVIATWARILQALPDARLILKAVPLGDAAVRARFHELFLRAGVSLHRVELLAPVPSKVEHLATYDRVDIALDPFPYNGTTTTCEALWMGVPVITLAGQAHAGRVGMSLLNQVGLAELIAESPEAYVELAVGLARDRDRLRALREGLRDRMQRSPLMDAAGFTRSLEAAYREMWKTYCKNSGSA